MNRGEVGVWEPRGGVGRGLDWLKEGGKRGVSGSRDGDEMELEGPSDEARRGVFRSRGRVEMEGLRAGGKRGVCGSRGGGKGVERV